MRVRGDNSERRQEQGRKSDENVEWRSRNKKRKGKKPRETKSRVINRCALEKEKIFKSGKSGFTVMVEPTK